MSVGEGGMSVGEDGMSSRAESMGGAREQEIARYVAQVRQELGDLPPQVRDELLEDLPEHLAEVAAETDGPLADRLGPPRAYAAELRGAAGVRPPATGRNLDQKIAAAVEAVRGRLRTVDAKAGPLIGYARASEYLRLLRPMWWVLRGYLVAMAITVFLYGGPFGLLPRVGGETLTAVLLLAATVLGSIWLGRRSERFGPRSRLVLHASALVLVIFALFGFVDADQRARNDYYEYQQIGNPYSGIQDVFVYDSEGRLIEGARLFDQNGQPIRLGNPWCAEVFRQPTGNLIDGTYPYCPQAAPFRVPAPERPVPSDSVPPAPAETAPTPEPTGTPGTPASSEPTEPSGAPAPAAGSPGAPPTVSEPPVPAPTG